MNLNDRIVSMLKAGIAQITIGMNPEGVPFVAVVQQVKTGPEGNLSTVTHQAVNDSVGQCFEEISKRVEHCQEMRATIIRGNN